MWSRSGRVESVVKVDTPVKNFKVVLLLCSGALCQELHIFIWGRGMSEDNPRDLSQNWMRRMEDQGRETRKSCKTVCSLLTAWKELYFLNLFLFLTVQLSEKRLLTPMVCFPSCKESFFSLDKTCLVSFTCPGWDTKRRNTMWKSCNMYGEKRLWVIWANYPQCHCHCRQPPQRSWTNNPLCSPSVLLWPPGLFGLTAVALSHPTRPRAHRGLAPLEVVCLWELSSWCSFLHSWGHWPPRGGSPPACPGRWPGRREKCTSDMWCRWNYGSRGQKRGSCMFSLKIAFLCKTDFSKQSWPVWWVDVFSVCSLVCVCVCQQSNFPFWE